MSAETSPGGGLRGAWPLLVAGFVINFVLMGGGVDTVSIFLHAISESEGWSSSSLSGGITVAALSAALCTPIVGIAIDRWGVRVPMSFGLLLFAIGYTILLWMSEPWQWFASQLFLGAGFAFSAILPIIIAVTLCVPERTALALGLVAAGASLGTLILAPVLQGMVDAIGWRSTYMVLGSAVVIAPIPCLLFALPRGRLRRGAEEEEGGRSPTALGRELRRPEVLALATLMLIPALVSFGVHVHLVPYLSSLGHTSTLAAAALGAAIGISAVGKVAGGILGDRIGPLQAFRLALALEALALLALGLATSNLPLAVFVAAHGLAMGTRIAVIPVIAYAVLGPQRFATRFGLLQLVTTTGAGLAPLVPGLIYDGTGAYTGAVVFWVVAILVGVAIAFRLRVPMGARA
jgi:predicted MFS family arabinose efflux permease